MNRTCESDRTDRKPPPWLGRRLAIAQHQDVKAAWPWWKRTLHQLFVARRCPCCIAERQDARHRHLLNSQP